MSGEGASDAWAPGTVVGAFEILGEHARGGLGRVLRARDRRFEREVAIKVATRGSESAARRLAREARLTAHLQHPAIVPVYEEGCTPAGERYYVMKLVRGSTLADLIAARADLRDRLALVPHVLALVRAIAFAHQRGVIHRDLKPANVLVGPFGETVVADWGLGQRLASTEEAAVGGTPAFMAPEQAGGAAAGVQTDVYSLGATLYTVLARRPPYHGLASGEVAAAVCAGPPRRLTELEPGAPSDLVAISEHAMARDPRERYRTAELLAADLERFLAGRLVSVRQYPPWIRLARWAGRNRFTVGVASVLLVAILATGARAFTRVTAERDAARARAAELLLAQARTALDRDPTEAVAWLKRYPDGGADQEGARRIAIEAARRGVARFVYRHARPVFAVDVAGDGRVATGCQDHRARVFDGLEVQVLGGHATWVDAVRFSPDGRLLIGGARDGRLAAWDLVARAGGIAGDHRGSVRTWGAAFAGDREAVTVDSQGLAVWDLSDPARPHGTRAALAIEGCCTLLAAAAAGDRFAVVSWTAEVAVVDGAGRGERILGRIGPPRVASTGLALSPDGRRVVAARAGAGVLVWDAATGEPRRLAVAGVLPAVAVSADDRTIAVATSGGIALADLATGGERQLSGPPAYALAFSPDGRRLASFAVDTTPARVRDRVVVHDLRSGAALELRGQREPLAIAWSRDGRTLATASNDGQVRVWVAADPRPPEPAGSQPLHAWLEDLTTSQLDPEGRPASPVNVVGEIVARP